MELPEYIKVSDLEKNFPEEFTCDICCSPMTSAVSMQCHHRVCRRCASRMTNVDRGRCPFCRMAGSWRADASYNARLQLFVRDALEGRALELLLPHFTVLEEDLICRCLQHCIDNQNERIAVQKAAEILTIIACSRAPTTDGVASADTYGDAERVCTSATDLASIQPKSTVRSLRVCGRWFNSFHLLGGFTGLRDVQVSNAADCLSFDGIDDFPSLQRLCMEQCGVVSIDGIDKSRSLSRIEVRQCPRLERMSLPSMVAAPQPGALIVTDCPRFSVLLQLDRNIRLGELRVAHSKFSNHSTESERRTACPPLFSLKFFLSRRSPLACMSALTVLDVSDTPFSCLDALPSCAQLTELRVSGCPLGQNLLPLKTLRHLKVLAAARTALTSLAGLENFLYLESVDVRGCRALADFASLLGLVHLKWLDAADTALNSVAHLRSTRSFEHVDLTGCGKLCDLSPWAGLGSARRLHTLLLARTAIAALPAWDRCPPSLTRLDLSDCGALDSVQPLTTATRLTHLCLDGTKVADLAPLARCAATLQELRLRGCPVRDVAVLRGARALRVLDIASTCVTDIAPLAGCVATLSTLRLAGCAITDFSVLQQAGCVPDTEASEGAVRETSARAVPLPPATDALQANTSPTSAPEEGVWHHTLRWARAFYRTHVRERCRTGVNMSTTQLAREALAQWPVNGAHLQRFVWVGLLLWTYAVLGPAANMCVLVLFFFFHFFAI